MKRRCRVSLSTPASSTLCSASKFAISGSILCSESSSPLTRRQDFFCFARRLVLEAPCISKQFVFEQFNSFSSYPGKTADKGSAESTFDLFVFFMAGGPLCHETTTFFKVLLTFTRRLFGVLQIPRANLLNRRAACLPHSTRQLYIFATILRTFAWGFVHIVLRSRPSNFLVCTRFSRVWAQERLQKEQLPNNSHYSCSYWEIQSQNNEETQSQ